MASIDEIRAWAMALPEVTEKQHFKFKVPQWQVRGTTFMGIGRDQTTAVFRVTKDAADAAAAADPEHATAVRRSDARRSFLGLEVRLAGVPPERIRQLVRESWAAQAPKRLAEGHTGS